jgi:small subunit ribosomal protein S17
MAEEKKKKNSKKALAGAILSRGRIFQGRVIAKHPKRITIEFDRPVYLRKYERYFKKKTKIHARLPENMDVEIEDMVKVRECRPLSKTIHFVVTEITKKSSEPEEDKK